MAKGKYQEWIELEGLLKIEGWARDGLVEEQIAANMGIAVSTLNVWKNSYIEISESLKRGKEVIDRQVENALLKRALGYKYEEVKTEEWEDSEGNPVEKKTTTVKEVIPDTTAQIFWLKNRKPAEWRDKQNIEHSGGVNVRSVYENMSEEELMELAKKYEKINDG